MNIHMNLTNTTEAEQENIILYHLEKIAAETTDEDSPNLDIVIEMDDNDITQIECICEFLSNQPLVTGDGDYVYLSLRDIATKPRVIIFAK